MVQWLRDFPLGHFSVRGLSFIVIILAFVAVAAAGRINWLAAVTGLTAAGLFVIDVLLDLEAR